VESNKIIAGVSSRPPTRQPIGPQVIGGEIDGKPCFFFFGGGSAANSRHCDSKITAMWKLYFYILLYS